MSSDDTTLISNPNSQSGESHSMVSGDAVAVKQKATLSDDGLKQDKFKQDQLKMDKFREEMLRQEKLRQELENQELERQQGQKQEQSKQQQLLKQEQLKKQHKLKQAQLLLAEQKRLAEEKKILEQVRINAERAAQDKIKKEQARQEKLMRARLEKKQLEREEQQKVIAAQTFEKQQLVIDSTPEIKPKSSLFGIGDKLRSKLKLVEESVTKVEAPEQTVEELVQPNKIIEASQEPINKPLVNARSFQLCGNIEDAVYSDNLDSVRYEPDDFLLSTVLCYLDQSKRESSVIRLNFDDIVIVIDYALNTIYCSLSLTSPKFDEFCSRPSMPSVDVYQLEFDEVRLERRNAKSVGNSIESFIWTCTLLTAKGRLPSYTDISRSIGIKQDADFSKLESIPCLDQIVEELKQGSCKLMEVSTRLNILQKYVFSFYNAAANLDFLEFDIIKKVTNPKKAKSGFFSFKK